MAITVRELLRLPHLRMTLIAGAGGLDRQITWVHTSDLPDPWEWLGSGELLLTNGTGLSPDSSAQVAFVERLAQTGASGLGIGLGMSGPPLAGKVSRRADELRLPLVAVPYSMPFTAVVRAVADANDREESRQLGRVARLYELLRTSVLAGRPGPEMFTKLGQELDVRLYLVDPETGQSVFGDGEGTSFGAALVASYAAHGNTIPGVLRLSLADAAPGDAGAVAVAVPGDRPTVLVAEPVGSQLPSLVLLHHIATGGALELAQLAAAQERQRRLGADLLSQLLDRRIDERVAEPQIADLGLDLAVSVLVVTRAGPGGAGGAGGVGGASGSGGASGAAGSGGAGGMGGMGGMGADLHRKLDRCRVPHLLLHADRMLYVVLPDGAAQAHLLPEPGEPARTIGSSGRIGGASRMSEAAQEARWALGAAEAEKRALVRYGDETALLLPRSATEAEILVSRILGPLIRADAEHGTDYVNTLRVVLDHDRSWLQASAKLHIHKQTLGYRIRKIEQLTGRGLARTEHLAEWWFALRAHDLLAGRHLNLADIVTTWLAPAAVVSAAGGNHVVTPGAAGSRRPQRAGSCAPPAPLAPPTSRKLAAAVSR